MISLLTGLLIVAFLLGVCFFISTTGIFSDSPREDKKTLSKAKEESSTTKSAISPEDIVLAKLTNSSGGQDDYALLWNGTPGISYNYEIAEKGLESVARGEMSSNSSVFKLRGLPLQEGKEYVVSVGETTTNINFAPPLILRHSMENGKIVIDTNIVPTGIEVISGAEKVPLSKCEIKIEPPGIICDMPLDSKPTVVIYNGPGAVNILF